MSPRKKKKKKNRMNPMRMKETNTLDISSHENQETTRKNLTLIIDTNDSKM